MDIQSHFDKYSVANGLLIYAQMPNATQLREYSEWKSVVASYPTSESNVEFLKAKREILKMMVQKSLHL